jgi:acyl carrier protein
LDTLKEIHDYLVAEFPSEQTSFAPDDNLLQLGIIDSMGLLKLDTHHESRYGFEATDDDMVPEHFMTLEKIRDFVEAKRKK